MRDSQYVDVFCFADLDHAQRFASEFRGEIILRGDPVSYQSRHEADKQRWGISGYGMSAQSNCSSLSSVDALQLKPPGVSHGRQVVVLS